MRPDPTGLVPEGFPILDAPSLKEKAESLEVQRAVLEACDRLEEYVLLARIDPHLEVSETLLDLEVPQLHAALAESTSSEEVLERILHVDDFSESDQDFILAEVARRDDLSESIQVHLLENALKAHNDRVVRIISGRTYLTPLAQRKILDSVEQVADKRGREGIYEALIWNKSSSTATLVALAVGEKVAQSKLNHVLNASLGSRGEDILRMAMDLPITFLTRQVVYEPNRVEMGFLYGIRGALHPEEQEVWDGLLPTWEGTARSLVEAARLTNR